MFMFMCKRKWNNIVKYISLEMNTVTKLWV